jgi:hypothetical protein
MRLAVALLLVFFLLPAQAYADQQSSAKQALSNYVRCVIRIDVTPWKRDGPAPVNIRLENLTDRNLDLRIIPTLYLTPVSQSGNEDAAYWAPTDIMQNKALDTQKKPSADGVGTSVTQIPLNVHLDKHGLSVFQIDASKSRWAKAISSIWPSSPMSIIPPGPYSLHLELDDNAGSLLRSNEVTVSLKK